MRDGATVTAPTRGETNIEVKLPGRSYPIVVGEGLIGAAGPRIAEALEGKVGPILAMPHLGSWEWSGYWLSRVKGHPVTAVVERIEPPALFEWFVGFRQRIGMNVVPLGPDAGREVVELRLPAPEREALKQRLAGAPVICETADEGRKDDIAFLREHLGL